MTLDPLLFVLPAGPSGDLLSGPWAVLRWLGGAGTWLLDHGLLVALATAAAAYIALQANRREEARIEERREAADARIAGLAFLVRRTLEKTLEDRWVDGASRDPRTRERAREVRPAFDEHEPRVERMLAEAAGASPEVAEAVRTASRLYWSAANGVNEAADAVLETTEYDPRSGEATEGRFEGDEEEALRQARETTVECVEILRRLDAPIREAKV